MRDIVYRRIQTAPEASSISSSVQKESLPIPPAPANTADWLLRVFHNLNHGLGNLALPKKTGITPRFVPSTTVAANLPVASKPTPKIARRPRTSSHPKAALKATKAHLKTTSGKVAAVQTIAIIALFAFVLTQQPSTPQQAERSSAGALQAGLRQYLPIVGDRQATDEPTTTKAAAISKEQVPLHTWVTPWNATQIESNLPQYRSLSAFWLTVQADGAGTSPKGEWQVWQQLRHKLTPDQSTYLTVTGDPDATYLAISNPTTQEALIKDLLHHVTEQNFDGIDLNFEGLGYENQELFNAFVRTTSTTFHAENKKVAVTLEARIANQVPMDWRTIGLVADEVRLMAYDYHAKRTSSPGPIAPLGWIKEVVDYATKLIDPEKIIVGLGNYGYDWTAPATPEESWEGVGISHERALSLSTEHQVPILQQTGIDERGYDIGQAPSFTYKDSEEKQHIVWFEDQASLEMKLNLLRQYPIRGTIFWSVGLGDSDFWTNQQTSKAPTTGTNR